MPLNEYEFPQSKLANVQSQLEKLVEKNFYLHTSARDAYRSYLLAYNSHQLKSIFNVHTLDLLSVAKSFGFAQPPRVSCPLEESPPCAYFGTFAWELLVIKQSMPCTAVLMRHSLTC